MHTLRIVLLSTLLSYRCYFFCTERERNRTGAKSGIEMRSVYVCGALDR